MVNRCSFQSADLQEKVLYLLLDNNKTKTFEHVQYPCV